MKYCFRDIVLTRKRDFNIYFGVMMCRIDYEIFGNALAFDAPYKKNMYLCPLVVFTGVNHHNQSIVLASAII